MIFSPSTGKTQGIRLRISPPANASASNPKKPPPRAASLPPLSGAPAGARLSGRSSNAFPPHSSTPAASAGEARLSPSRSGSAKRRLPFSATGTASAAVGENLELSGKKRACGASAAATGFFSSSATVPAFSETVPESSGARRGNAFSASAKTLPFAGTTLPPAGTISTLAENFFSCG